MPTHSTATEKLDKKDGELIDFIVVDLRVTAALRQQCRPDTGPATTAALLTR